MKHRLIWAIAGTVAVTATSLVETSGGVILISTRNPQDTQFGTEYYTDERGPGMSTPGDAAMASLLNDHGYSSRLILDKLLGPDTADVYLKPVNPDMKIDLAIMSGSGASADTPPPPPDIPVMMGEHVCLGNNAGRQGSIYMYNGTSSSDPNETTPASHYMKVIAPDHPIMKGIPLDDQGRVKIFRDAYPDEELHVPTGGKKNFEYRWCTQVLADAAAGTTVLGILDGTTDRACFAVVDVGGLLANGETAAARRVHMFMNEQGSGGARRVFLALTGWGRLLFVRAAKWALGETLQPYVPLRIKDITTGAPRTVKVSWDASAHGSYLIRASTDTTNWQTVVQDIAGIDGVVTRTLDIAAAPDLVFFKIAAVP